jgi:hypothetical protein
VSSVCFLPYLILGISTSRLKRPFKPSAKLSASYPEMYSLSHFKTHNKICHNNKILLAQFTTPFNQIIIY